MKKGHFFKQTLGILAATALTLAAVGAHADWRGSEYEHAPHQRLSETHAQQIDARQDRQQARIQAGLREGDLTRREFRKLMRQQHEIRTMEHHFLADGFLDAREFHRLNAALDEASQNIRRQRHDYQARAYFEYHPRYN